MYIPKHFELKEHSRIISFLKENNFALLLSSSGDKLTGTHLPFIVKEDEKNITLITHLAKANPQWKHINKKEVLVIFQGPHAYVSPALYNHKVNVPTWNYTSIHAYGICSVITGEDEMIKILLESFEAFEPSYRLQWDELPGEYRNGLLKGIIGLSISVTKLQAKFKLSQNKTRDEQERIIESFERSEDYLLTGVAELMKENLKQ